MNIHFIGIIHSDPLGSERLWNALSYEKPKAIAVECSQELRKYLVSGRWLREEKRVFKKYRKKGISEFAYQQVIRELVDMMFEVRVSLSYGRSQDIPVHLIDSKRVYDEIVKRHKNHQVRRLSDISYRTREIRKQEAEISYYDFGKLFDGSISDSLDREFSIALDQNDNFKDRDDRAEEKIRNLEYDKIVVVYGLAHCLHDANGNSLFSRLQDLNPTRKTLGWYDHR